MRAELSNHLSANATRGCVGKADEYCKSFDKSTAVINAV